jgi:stage V sporulation protein AF
LRESADTTKPESAQVTEEAAFMSAIPQEAVQREPTGAAGAYVSLPGKGAAGKESGGIPSGLDEARRILKRKAGLDESFDLIMREMVFGSKRTGILYLNGFAKDEVLTDIIERLTYAGEQSVEPDTFKVFYRNLLPHIQVDKVDKLDDLIGKVLAGACGLLIEGETTALAVDAKSYPSRSTEEPDLERVVRGSRDGFVETLMTNVTLVRRRLRDPALRLEAVQVGERTKTDVCLAYIRDIADPGLVEAVRDKIRSVRIEGIPLGEKQLEEMLVAKGWNPYPLVRYSERPDVVAVHLLEGHVAVFADTSPSAMILPATLFHHVQHVEEYRQSPVVGTYLRWVRFFGMLASVFLLPLWFLMAVHPELKPSGLEFIGPQKNGHVPLLLQFLLAELGIDLMRMAAVHTPTPLATAMGLVAAILIGDIAVKTGLFTNEVIMYLAVAAIGQFATPSYELGMANRLVRLTLLVAAAVFKVPGLVIGTTLWIVFLALQRSYNSPYLWPFIPFNGKALREILIRRTTPVMDVRPSLTKTRDSSRQPG